VLQRVARRPQTGDRFVRPRAEQNIHHVPDMAMTFANRTALAVWIFAAVWLAMLGMFTMLVIRDGPPVGYSLPFITVAMSAFWIGGVALISVALGKGCFVVSISPEQVTFTCQFPHKRTRIVVPTVCVGRAEVVEARDSEGDAYFYARLRLPDGTDFDLSEGPLREHCERTCREFSQAVERALAGPRALSHPSR
jgi:hypothetical protein